ncbi:MAG: hypothetical protein A3B06_02025 [Candidatus Yonathbacteria bacterium RIFCSPLOWO2_01_FULL_43_20]|uniref:Uncharacterized protein n=1 Tax=Candidatus Yonathbacteria bacterium RIFCSPHIGHO2_02_FULL_44_14 TaxID=1802724 RepID=A0A1G2S729_9BACT|nr:MAG: hypothetical protein A3D51_01550 [Candidatus Yonathbacteria bacterium RIFCSPHIGHO2_02_FULL_44_14]OHA82029.1 MAG: hypothetical protein A3B06_02025 [Candidatus Yonathbacteria bacterium RIFCSPLOWO2_01_FULL_43_20]
MAYNAGLHDTHFRGNVLKDNLKENVMSTKYVPMKIGQIAGILQEHRVLICDDFVLSEIYSRIVKATVMFEAKLRSRNIHLTMLDFWATDLPDSILEIFEKLKTEFNTRHNIMLPDPM